MRGFYTPLIQLCKTGPRVRVSMQARDSISECETRHLQVLTMSVLLPVNWGRVGWGIFSVCVVPVAALYGAEPVRFGRDVLPVGKPWI